MSDALVRANEQIRQDEGFRSHVYVCPAGFLTIGYGRNVDTTGPGITEPEAAALLANDLAACAADLASLFPGWPGFSLQRQATLINLRFQLGARGFRGFGGMVKAIQAGDWPRAASEVAWRNPDVSPRVPSPLMTQTPGRTSRRVRELEQG